MPRSFPLVEELSCAVSQLVLHVPVTALDRSSGSQHPANWWTVCDCVGGCVCVCVRVALRALCWFYSAVSVTHWAGSVGVPWFPSCCVYSICLLPQNTLKSIIRLSLFFSIFHSVDLSYLLLTSLDLSFQISSCVVVRWCACRQTAPVSSSAGDRIEFLSQPSS